MLAPCSFWLYPILFVRLARLYGSSGVTGRGRVWLVLVICMYDALVPVSPVCALDFG